MASIPVFITWVTSQVVTAAQMNSNIRDAGNFFLSWPVAELRQTVAQSLTSGSGAAITLDTEDVDTDNGHSTVTNTSRYTPQTQGRFQHSGGIGYVSSSAGARYAYWSINGSAINAGMHNYNAGTTGVLRITAPTLTSFFNGSTDYLELFGLQSSGGALNTDITTGALGGQPRMSVRMIGTV
jgi:hypothetical protein